MPHEYRLNRLFSKPLTSLLLKTPATPNQITAASLGCGLLSGYLFSTGQYASSLAAAGFYQLAVVLDNCDGEIARAKNLGSKFGEWFDIAADLATDLALFLGLAIGVAKKFPDETALLPAILCVGGALAHSGLVALEKTKGFGPAVFEKPNPDAAGRRGILFKLFEALREGDLSWFVVLFAVLGRVEWLLWLGGVYMQFLWISGLAVNYKWLFTNENR